MINIATMHPLKLIEALKAGQKRSDTVFVIGGGPSLLQILPDPRILDDQDIICTNNAYKLYPNAMLLHFADKVWWNWHQKPIHNVKANFHGYISSATNHQNYHIDKNEKRVSCFKNGNKSGGINTDPTKVDGNNTGHQAINIAVHLGYEQIVLIGFDMLPERQTHWHTDHERPTNVDNFQRTMIPGFSQIVPFQKELGFTIYNLNHKSGIRDFEFANLSDFI